MAQTRYLSVLDLEALHIFIMEKTGNAPALLRERALLESAVMRPQMAAYYADADLIEQAALLAVGISQAQAFLEGNKRTALLAVDIFLRINGWRFIKGPLEIAQQLEAVATRKGNIDEATARFTDWLRTAVARDVASGDRSERPSR